MLPPLDRAWRVEHRRRPPGWTRSPLRVDAALCVACDGCARACPPRLGAVVRTGSLGVAVRVVPELCNGCGRCVAACPVDCLVPDPGWAPAPDDWWDALTGAGAATGAPTGHP